MPTPALLTGTSSEFLGRRPLPHVLRRRSSVLIFGPESVGKTTIARRLAGAETIRLDTRQLQTALVERVSMRAWKYELLMVPGLILDGPVWLHNRPGAVECLAELMQVRGASGRRTYVCQRDTDGSAQLLCDELGAGEVVVLGLRLPKGRRGRMRFARRICDQLNLPRIAARGTDELEPWGYAAVIRKLGQWKRDNPGLFD